MLLLQEFDISIKDRPGTANLVADHLSKLLDGTRGLLASDLICDDFPDASLMSSSIYIPWFTNLVNYIITSLILDICLPFRLRNLNEKLNITFGMSLICGGYAMIKL